MDEGVEVEAARRSWSSGFPNPDSLHRVPVHTNGGGPTVAYVVQGVLNELHPALHFHVLPPEASLTSSAKFSRLVFVLAVAL